MIILFALMLVELLKFWILAKTTFLKEKNGSFCYQINRQREGQVLEEKPNYDRYRRESISIFRSATNRRIAAQKENCSLTNSPTIQEKAKNPGIRFAELDVGMTLDDLIQQSSEKLEGIREELGVTQPSLKRLCQELSSYWWPLIKRNKVDENLPIPRTRSASVDPVGGETIKDSKTLCYSNNNATRKVGSTENSILTGAEVKSIARKHFKIESINTMIVKATYGGDIVTYPFFGSSGIGKLRSELDKRFELKVERFKIKYEDDGKWIMMCCDDDLRFHRDSLKASGLTMMKLPVSLPN